MANAEHVMVFKQGVEAWNNWRKENPEIKPDLSEADLAQAQLTADFIGPDLYRADLRSADLRGADLRKANFRRADLSGANLSEANLSEADMRGAKLNLTNLSLTNLSWTNFRRAKLNEANFIGADLRGADLRGAYLTGVFLSGAAIDENTRYNQIKGSQPGLNGFWCRETDSAALVTHTPPGNSMRGSNPDAVIACLKQARSLHTCSITLAGLAFLMTVFRLPDILGKFALFAMPISLGLLGLVGLYLGDALRNVGYLCDRDAAVKVGSFPWVLSKYGGSSIARMLISLAARLVIAFHPGVYWFYWLQGNWQGLTTVYQVLLFSLLICCAWIFFLSQLFQKPILFDTRTENNRVDDLNQLSEDIKHHSKIVAELVSSLQPKQNKGSGENGEPQPEMGLQLAKSVARQPQRRGKT